MVKKLTTTFDKWMADPEIKEHFDKDYKNFVLSELILALMENDGKSVRKVFRGMARVLSSSYRLPVPPTP